jgi:hypothetical protein
MDIPPDALLNFDRRVSVREKVAHIFANVARVIVGKDAGSPRPHAPMIPATAKLLKSSVKDS